jgi:lactoylglutathione lyase
MHLGYIIIYVTDVEATVAFYEKAFELPLNFLHESKQYADLKTGATKLAFVAESFIEENVMPFAKNSLVNKPAGFEIGLVVANVQEAYEKALKGGAVAVQAPQEKPWGQTIAYVRDMNGVLVELCTKMD